MPARTPDEVDRLFAQALNDGDAEGIVALYEPNACLVPQPGTTAVGTEAIRQAVEGLLAMKPKISLETQSPLVVGDVALTTSRWRLTGSSPDGDPVDMNGVSAEVARRQPDGTWRFVIDNPFPGS